MKRIFLILTFILLLASILRFPFLDKFPNGFSGDEAIQGYTAYSILKTGKDEWGKFLPIFPRGFGDFKPPLYSYFSIPFIAAFGLNEFAARLPAAIFGIATIFLFYFFVKQILQKEEIALAAAFFLAISPWHFQFSRTAFEGILLPFFFLLGLYFYLKAKKDLKFLILTALFFGLSLYTYQAAKVFVPLFLLFSLLFWRPKIKKETLIAIFIFLVLLLPNLFFGQARFSDISIFNKSHLATLNDRRFICAQSLPDSICRISYNKATFWSGTFLETYFSYFSFQFLFTGTRPADSYLNFPDTPLYHLFQLPLIIFGFWFLRKAPIFSYLVLWLLLAPVPASLTIGGLNANRTITFLPVLEIFAAGGFVWLWQKMNVKLIEKIFSVTSVAIIILSLGFILESYFIRLPKNPAESLRYGYRDTIRYTESVKDQYDKIIFSKVYSEPQAFVAFYSRLDPKIYQSYSKDYLRYEKEGKKFLDQLESYQLGKYEFRDIYWEKDKKLKNTLLVGSPQDFPANVSGVKTIDFPNGKVAFRIVESEVQGR